MLTPTHLEKLMKLAKKNKHATYTSPTGEYTYEMLARNLAPALVEAVNTLGDALRWYSNTYNYCEGVPGKTVEYGSPMDPIEYDWESDNGYTAREALAKVFGPTPEER